MVGWHHQLNGHEFEQDLGTVKDREAWCHSPRDHKELDMTEQLKIYNKPQNSFPVTQPTACAGITWTLSCHPVRTGAHGTVTNANILAIAIVVSNKVLCL